MDDGWKYCGGISACFWLAYLEMLFRCISRDVKYTGAFMTLKFRRVQDQIQKWEQSPRQRWWLETSDRKRSPGEERTGRILKAHSQCVPGTGSARDEGEQAQ